MFLKYFLALGMTVSLIGHSFISYAQLPVDPSIVHGGAVFDTVGNHMTIINSPNAILDWQSFSIGADSSVYFQQQDATSMILNRVTGNDPSHIFGSLGSNGHIWLINPYGVLFGEHARIDAAGLMASTMDIANIDFLAKRYHFNSTSITGEVRNQGEIRTSLGGRVWLMGDRVQNDGLVQTPSGQTVIAAGKSVEFVDSGAPNVVVRVKAPENEVVNLGSLVASSGQVDLHGSIVNQEGIVRANSVGTDETGRIVLKADQATLAKNSQTQADQGAVYMEVSSTLNNWGAISGKDIALNASEILQQGQIIAQGGNVALTAQTSAYLNGTVDVSNAQSTGGNILLTTNKLEGMAGGVLRADGKQGGHIRIESNGSVAFSSTLAATGSTQGGTIEVTGDRVYLLNTDIDASGGMQGGTVHLGGGWQGSGDLPHAREVLVGVGSEVKANGGTFLGAKGGEIAVWSTQNSEHYGSLQAKDGGRIEFSSQGIIRQTGDIQVGTGGMVLLDPKNLVIADSPPDNLVLVQKMVSGHTLTNGTLGLENEGAFGAAIALEGDRLVVGADFGDTPAGESGTGSVYLFTGIGTDLTGLTLRGKITSGQGAINMQPLANGDAFGTALALEGDRLVVGARNDDDPQQTNIDRGAVHLFTGVGTDFSGLAWQKKLTSGQGAINMQPLASGDGFGASVALDGDRLVVGAMQDDTGGIDRGAVYLFAGAENDFTGLNFQKKLTSGQGAFNMQPLNNNDFFGAAVALDGDRLAVGARGGGEGPGPGAVHLFTGVGEDFSNLTWRKIVTSNTGANGMPQLENGDRFGRSIAFENDLLVVGSRLDGPNNRGAVYLFTGAQNDFAGLNFQIKLPSGQGAANIPDLVNGDTFGAAVALDAGRLVVGADSDNTGGTNLGAVYLFPDVKSLIGTDVNDARFGINPSGDSYITPAKIKELLDVGSAVTLQANNDITVQSAIEVNADGDGGDLTLQAGRNITFNADVTTDNGNLTAIAGDSNADQNNRDPGTPILTINNAILNGGSGTITLAAVDGNFINNNGDGAILTDGGRWLIYAANPTTSNRGDLSGDNKRYNQAFTQDIVPDYASNGNWFFYSVAPTLLVKPVSSTMTYGDSLATSYSYSLSGFIPGDADASIANDSTVFNVGGSRSSSGNVTAGFHDIAYVSGLKSTLGYLFADDTSSSNELTVTPAPALIYVADPATRSIGRTVTSLTGDVIGFIPGENRENATTGNLIWSTPTTENSPVGRYLIEGSGLSASNYAGFVQDPRNLTALNLIAFDPEEPASKQATTDTSIQATNTATSATRSADAAGTTGRVNDATSPSAGSFGRLSLAQMSFSEMQQIIDFRRELKQTLLSDGVSKLEIDPKLSDVMICTSIRKEDLNSCRITDDQRKEIKSKRVEEQQRKHRSIHKVRVASLPQIERKIIVLFGIDQYVDKTIPALQSAVSDIEAIGQLFVNKLGYDEARIVRNATRADIIRALNELSIEMEANDSVVIYYAGHGYMNTKTGNGYWIPSDASAKNPQSWISNTSISEMLVNITSKQMVMISDSCYSGAFTKEQKIGLNIQNAKPDDILGKRSVVVMASGGDEPVADEGRGGHSIFAWFLMQALQNVENWKIGTNVFEQIQNNVKKSFPQVPQYGAAVSAGHQEGGDYLFEFRQLESVGN
ncbi:MAG TPA: caspase family protein [Nitrosomonas sp.]|nr:caspase family protein [Nitrosomonas sp.]